MNSDFKIQYWIDLAIDDLDSAKIMLDNSKYLQCGFYCHQVVEKTIKGYFWFVKNEEPPYSHNLLKLSIESGLDQLLSEEHKKIIDLLMPLNIEARYPDEKHDILKNLSASKIKMIYQRTVELNTWILTLLKK